MENYEVEPSHINHEVDPCPFEEFPNIFEVPKDKGAKSLANKYMKVLGPGRPIVLYASGAGTANAITCAEIIKTYFKHPIHQCTRIGQIRTIETWNPIAEGLDPLKVTRSVPMIFILMALEKIEENEGYQKSSNRRKDVLSLAMSDLSSTLYEEYPLEKND